MAPASRPRLPIGISDFRKLREPGMLYVDKTDFIVQVLASRAEVVLVPRPRRFGKTVNLSTLRYFLEQSEEDRTAMFEGLAVARSEAAKLHFQRHPVIWLTFKDVKAQGFDAAFAAIRAELSRAYGEHAYLLKEGALDPWDAARFEQILREEGPDSLYAGSILDLSRHLARYHGERVVVLCDEYDTPIHAASSPEDERRRLDFFRAFLSGGLKDNDAILQALERLDTELGHRGVRAELFLVVGAVMCLVHNARPSTKDVDAWFTEPQVVREAVRAVASDLDLPEDWLNDAAKGFVPQNAGYETWQVLPNLTISTVDARTLLAMKCAAARAEVDAADIRTLARLLGLTSSEEVLRVVLAYFPPERLPVRVRLLLEEMFDEGD